MTYSQLETLVDNYKTQRMTEEIVALITPQNVRTVIKCTGVSSAFDTRQQLTRPTKLHDDYLQLKDDVLAAASVNVILHDYFTVENIIVAAFGQEYEAAYTLALAQFTTDGWPDPVTKAEDEIERATQELEGSLNPKPVGLC